MDEIHVDTHRFDSKYVLNNVRNTEDRNIYDLGDLYNLLEKILVELVDNLFRLALSHELEYKYVNIGGKSINLYIKQKYLKKSFDFDIHLHNTPDHIYNSNDVAIFGKRIADRLNNLITNTFPLFRLYIFHILKYYNLVTDAQKHHYENQPIFYYGTRSKRYFSIKGIFIDFLFRDNLYGAEYYSNDPNKINVNELYYPISDIDLEESLNFGVPIRDDGFIVNGYDGVRYCNYIISLHNLITYANQGGPKMGSNLNKLDKFTNIQKYSCYCLNKYEGFQNQLLNLHTNQTITNDISELTINGTKIFSVGKQLKNILEKFVHFYQENRNRNLNICKDQLLLNNNAVNRNHILHMGDDDGTFALFEKIIYNNDHHRYLLYYTGDGFIPINTRCDYNYFDINNDFLIAQVYFNDVTITFSDGEIANINQIENIVDVQQLDLVIQNISDTIHTIHSSHQFRNLVNRYFNDIFTVYRMQNYMCINSPNGDQFNISALKNNTIIYMPRFLSTSFKTNNNYQTFVKANTFIMRISIRKTSKKWVFLNSYSLYPFEGEILIDRNSFLVVRDDDYYPIKTDGIRDIRVINLFLCDTLEEATSLIDEPEIDFINFDDRYFEDRPDLFHGDIPNMGNSKKKPDIVQESKIKYKKCINTNMKLFDDNSQNDPKLLSADMIRYHELLKLLDLNQYPLGIKNNVYYYYKQNHIFQKFLKYKNKYLAELNREKDDLAK